MALYDVLFDLSLALSERFPSLNPIELRRQKAREVFKLMQRLVAKKQRDTAPPVKRVIRRPAGDNWF